MHHVTQKWSLLELLQSALQLKSKQPVPLLKGTFLGLDLQIFFAQGYTLFKGALQ